MIITITHLYEQSSPSVTKYTAAVIPCSLLCILHYLITTRRIHRHHEFCGALLST